MATSHYDTLGVAEGADPDEVRRAYLQLARRLHPDRWVDAAPHEQEAAERRMQDVTEAWRVLGNAGRRLAYDAGRRRPRPTQVADGASFTTGSLVGDDDVVVPDLVTRLLRAAPWVALILVLGGIFVFTAYATSDDGEQRCIRRDGGEVEEVDCEVDGARVVVQEVRDVGDCPSSTEGYQPAGDEQALCLER